jgi:hypothetical protein
MEARMKYRNRLAQWNAAAIASGLLTILVSLGAAPSIGWAAEKGKFRGMAVLMNVQFQEIKALEGHPGGPQMAGEMDGLVFNDNRQPFLDKAHYQVIWSGNNTGGPCFKSFTMPDGKVFARCDGKPTPTGFEGTLMLMGGTGRYAGIKGNGNFVLTTVSDRVMWDVLEWEYEIP